MKKVNFAEEFRKSGLFTSRCKIRRKAFDVPAQHDDAVGLHFELTFDAVHGVLDGLAQSFVVGICQGGELGQRILQWCNCPRQRANRRRLPQARLLQDRRLAGAPRRNLYRQGNRQKIGAGEAVGVKAPWKYGPYQTAKEAFKHRGRPVDEFSQIIGADVADATLEGFIQYATAALRVRLDRRDTGRL